MSKETIKFIPMAQLTEMYDAEMVSVGLVDKLSLYGQKVAKREATKAEGRHMRDISDLFQRLFEDTRMPHVKRNRA